MVYGADTLTGGDGADAFIGGNVGDTVGGGEGGTDNDTLDLTGQGPLRVHYDAANPENGYVEFRDADGNTTGTMTFENTETVIPCFTPDTMITTAEGQRPVQGLRQGDKKLITDGKDGIMVPPKNPDALAGAIQGVINDKSLATSLSKAGRDRIVSSFDSNIGAETILAEIARK